MYVSLPIPSNRRSSSVSPICFDSANSNPAMTISRHLHPTPISSQDGNCSATGEIESAYYAVSTSTSTSANGTSSTTSSRPITPATETMQQHQQQQTIKTKPIDASMTCQKRMDRRPLGGNDDDRSDGGEWTTTFPLHVAEVDSPCHLRSPTDPRSPTSFDPSTEIESTRSQTHPLSQSESHSYYPSPTPSRPNSSLNKQFYHQPNHCTQPIVGTVPHDVIACTLPNEPTRNISDDSPAGKPHHHHTYSTPSTVRSLQQVYELARPIDGGGINANVREDVMSEKLPDNFLTDANHRDRASTRHLSPPSRPSGPRATAVPTKTRAPAVAASPSPSPPPSLPSNPSTQSDHSAYIAGVQSMLNVILSHEHGPAAIRRHLCEGGHVQLHSFPLSTQSRPRTLDGSVHPSSSSPALARSGISKCLWASADLKQLYIGDIRSSVPVNSTVPFNSRSITAIPVSQIVVLFTGQQTRVFRDLISSSKAPSSSSSSSSSLSASSVEPPSGGRCFSLVTPAKTLDLECDSQHERDAWILALHFLLEVARTSGGTDGGEASNKDEFEIHPHETLLDIMYRLSHADLYDSVSLPSSQTTSPDLAHLARCMSSSSSDSMANNGPPSSLPSSSSSSHTSTPAFGSPIVSPAQVTRGLTHYHTISPMMMPTSESALVDPQQTTSPALTSAQLQQQQLFASQPQSLYGSLSFPVRRKSFVNLEPLTERDELLDDSSLSANEFLAHIDGSSMTMPIALVTTQPTAMEESEDLDVDDIDFDLPTLTSFQSHTSLHQSVTPTDSCTASPDNAPSVSSQSASIHPISPSEMSQGVEKLSLAEKLPHMRQSSSQERLASLLQAFDIPPPTTSSTTHTVSKAVHPIFDDANLADREKFAVSPIRDKAMPTVSDPNAAVPPSVDPSVTDGANAATHSITSPPRQSTVVHPSSVRSPRRSSRLVSAGELSRLRSLIARERSDHSHLRVWVAHRFMHLQSHINSLMIERHKLIAQQTAQIEAQERAYDDEIRRVMGAKVNQELADSMEARRCHSAAT